ncbi:hypothetical protein [Natrononativus amylolyticus]|uniref:hypothetical protein n=1 Tax=Natrononativus amylolyticus TaxID=2963434 RepID=UPI0020CBE8BF|nr:hypothetical protein [Natrononativus amylolyticus]
MTYTHYGEIGDVWKHLPLAEILAMEPPAAYWESHAASGLYELAPEPNQVYGAVRYLERATASDVLRRSPYTELLESYRNDEGVLDRYPGSPVIAMSLLEGTRASSDRPTFLFCDTEAAAVRSVREHAHALGVRESDVTTVHGDGISTLFDALSTASSAEIAGTFAHVDPYTPMAAGERGRTGWDLFRRLLEKGVRAMLWYGYQTEDEEAQWRAFLEDRLDSTGFDGERYGLWTGEIVVDAFADPETSATHPGVFGSGVLCGNLADRTIDRCRAVGEGLVSCYADAVLPDGNDGSLSFVEPCP